MSNPQIPTKMKLLFGELDITPRVEERLEELEGVAELLLLKPLRIDYYG